MDPDPIIHFNADLDPAPYNSDANLQLLILRPSLAPFWSSVSPLRAPTALIDSILSLQSFFNLNSDVDRDPAFVFDDDPNPASLNNADPDPLHCQ